MDRCTNGPVATMASRWGGGVTGLGQGHAQYVVAGGGMALDVVVARLARGLH